MAYSIKYDKSVIKFLEKRESSFKIKVLDFFDEIAKSPFTNNLDIKPLKGEKWHFRLRVGKYRYAL